MSDRSAPRRTVNVASHLGLILLALGSAVPAQLTLVADLVPGIGSSSPGEVTAFFGRTAFTAGPTFGRDLWVTDGTSANTVMIHNGDVADGQVFVAHDHLVFLDLSGSTQRVYASDGSAAGTQLLFSAISTSDTVALRKVYRGWLFFTAGDVTGMGSPMQLYRTDGVTVEAVGNHRVFGLGGDAMAGTDDALYFLGTGPAGQGLYGLDDGNPANGTKLIRSGPLGDWVVTGDDGIVYWNFGETILTLKRGSLLKQVYDSGDPTFRPIAPFVSGERLYFTGYTPVAGEELWVSDGTLATTRMVADLWPGRDGSRPYGFTQCGIRVVFFATEPNTGRELWVTDGGSSGTFLLKDINPGPASGCLANGTMVSTGTRIAYFTADDGVTGFELWRTTGWQAARKVNLALPDPNGSTLFPYEMAVNGGGLYFGGTSFTFGRELWRLQLEASSQPTGFSCSPNGNYPTLAATDPELGIPCKVTVRGHTPGTSLALFIDHELPSPVTYSGCHKLYSFSSAYVLLPLPTGDLDFSFIVPNDPVLNGLVGVLQGLAFPTPNGIETTNGYEIVFGR